MYPVFFYNGGILLSDPIIIDGAISVNWLLGILFLIVGFFVVRTLNKLETGMKELNVQVTKLNNDHIEFRADLKKYSSEEYVKGQNVKIAELIYAKIKGITPP